MGSLSKSAGQLAYEIVNALISDLNDRSGLGIDSCDADTQQEIRDTWESKVSEIIRDAESGSW